MKCKHCGEDSGNVSESGLCPACVAVSVAPRARIQPAAVGVDVETVRRLSMVRARMESETGIRLSMREVVGRLISEWEAVHAEKPGPKTPKAGKGVRG